MGRGDLTEGQWRRIGRVEHALDSCPERRLWAQRTREVTGAETTYWTAQQRPSGHHQCHPLGAAYRSAVAGLTWRDNKEVVDEALGGLRRGAGQRFLRRLPLRRLHHYGSEPLLPLASEGCVARAGLEAVCRPCLDDPLAVQGKVRRISRNSSSSWPRKCPRTTTPPSAACAVISRKISGGTRSNQGTDAKMTLSSLWYLAGPRPKSPHRLPPTTHFPSSLNSYSKSRVRGEGSGTR